MKTKKCGRCNGTGNEPADMGLWRLYIWPCYRCNGIGKQEKTSGQ